MKCNKKAMLTQQIEKNTLLGFSGSIHFKCFSKAVKNTLQFLYQKNSEVTLLSMSKIL